MRALGGAGGRPPAFKPWLAAQHAAGATWPAVLGVPQAALTGPRLAALTAVPCRVSVANSMPRGPVRVPHTSVGWQPGLMRVPSSALAAPPPLAAVPVRRYCCPPAQGAAPRLAGATAGAGRRVTGARWDQAGPGVGKGLARRCCVGPPSPRSREHRRRLPARPVSS
jgi:hypothetical protein